MAETIIVSSTTITAATGSGQQAKVIYATNSARWWLFYLSAAGTLATYYSADGSTWTAGGSLTLSHNAGDGRNIGVSYANISTTDVVHIALWGNPSGTAFADYVRATISGTTISFGSVTALTSGALATAYTFSGDNYAFDSTNKPVRVSFASNGDPNVFIATNADAGSSWTAGFGAAYDGFATVDASASRFICGLASGALLHVADNGSTYGTPNNLVWNTYNGTAWGGSYTSFTGITIGNYNDWGIAKLSNTDVHLVVRTGTNTFTHQRFNGSSWSSGSAIPNQTSLANGGVAVVSDGTNVWVFIIDSATGNAVKYLKWTSGTGWDTSWSTLESTSATRTYLSACREVHSSTIQVVWTEGAASPWKIAGEQLSFGGGGGTAWNQNVSDSHSGLELQARKPTKALSETHSGLDSLTKQAIRQLVETHCGVESLLKQVAKAALVEGTSATDSWQRLRGALLTILDMFSEQDTLLRTAGKYPADGSSGQDSLQKRVTHVLGDAISQIDILSKVSAKTLVEWLSETDSATATKQVAGASWSRTVLENQSALDFLTRTVRKLPADTWASIDTFSRVWVANLLVTEVFSATDILAKQVTHRLGETQSALDTTLLLRGALITVLDSLSQQEVQQRVVQHLLSEITSAQDIPLKQVRHTVADTLSLADRVTAGCALLLVLIDAYSQQEGVVPTLTTISGRKTLAMLTSLVASRFGISITMLASPFGTQTSMSGQLSATSTLL